MSGHWVTLRIVMIVAMVGMILSGGGAAISPQLSNLSGEYHFTHEIKPDKGLLPDETMAVVDVLQIVPLSRTKAFVAMQMIFNNVHTCELHEIADYRHGSLWYRGKATLGGLEAERECLLEIKPVGERLVTIDRTGLGACQNLCSGQGYLQGQGFPIASRRPITDVGEILWSDEYRRAQETFRKIPHPID
jgi:hypothetical protein